MSAKALVAELTRRKLKIATVESCTGGALASAITDVPGASEVFSHGFVTYSNQAKLDLCPHWYHSLQQAIKKHTVYSPQVAVEMARLGRVLSKADIGVGITGRLEEAQGVVDVAVSIQGRPVEFPVRMVVSGEGTRKAMKEQIVQEVLGMILTLVGKRPE